MGRGPLAVLRPRKDYLARLIRRRALRTSFFTIANRFLGGSERASTAVRQREDRGRKDEKPARNLGWARSLLPRVGRSAGLRSERTRENQAHMSKRCTSFQKRATKIAIMPVYEAPRTRPARQLLLPSYIQQKVPRRAADWSSKKRTSARSTKP